MRAFLDHFNNTDLGDKVVNYVVTFGFGFITAMLIFENVVQCN